MNQSSIVVRSRVMACILVSCVALALCAIGGIGEFMPAPLSHDEYSYLLAGETFAEGRVTNPVPEDWEVYETLHQLVRPSRQSKYPPAQGLTLALGFRLGHPILGVWLSVALMAATITWMLQAFVERRWALAGGLFAALKFAATGVAFEGAVRAYWAQSYWGGAMAAGAGALFFGAAARGTRARGGPVCMGSLAGLALVLLANSRPKEGLVAVLPIGVYLLVRFARGRVPKAYRARFLLACTAVLLAGTAGTLSYHQAVTGEALRIPWIEYQEQYSVAPPMIFQDVEAPPKWRNEQMAQFHGEREVWFHQRHRDDFPRVTAAKIYRFWSFFFGPILSLAVLGLLTLPRRRGVALAIGSIGLVLGSNLLTYASFPHYSAPVAAWTTLLVVVGLRALSRNFSRGSTIVAVVLIGAVVMAAFGIVGARSDVEHKNGEPRELLIRELTEKGGRHLVVVHYDDTTHVGNEWVFNSADLESAPVIFVRDIDAESTARVRARHPSRIHWRIVVSGTKVDRIALERLER